MRTKNIQSKKTKSNKSKRLQKPLDNIKRNELFPEKRVSPLKGKRAKTYSITEEQREIVTTMAAVGIPHEEIARVIVPGGMAMMTLRKHFQEELETSAIKANAMVARTLWQQAVSGNNFAATAFWCKTRMGFSEKLGELQIQESGQVDHRHAHIHKIDLSNMDTDELRLLSKIIANNRPQAPVPLG